MLPTKLARAALRGMRSEAVPPGAVGALMGLSWEYRRQRGGVPEVGGRAEPGAVSGAALRCCARRPGSPAASSQSEAYVPTGYVPDGEVMAVTLSSRRHGSIPGSTQGAPKA